MATPFRGWSGVALDFYRELEANNNRAFWSAHKAIYDAEVKAPFDALSDVIADEFGPLKVFRPYRNLRFSKDKTPYKTRCYAVADGQNGEAFYVELSARGLVSASGYWTMAKDQLTRFREAVDDEQKGRALETTIVELRARQFDITGHMLKTTPHGYPRDHPRVELLRYKSLAVTKSFGAAAWLGTPAAYKRITDVWRAAAPVNEWLGEHVGRSTEAPPDSR